LKINREISTAVGASLLLGLAIFLIILEVYFYKGLTFNHGVSNVINQTSAPSVTTAEWKTYRDVENLIEFKYPTDWYKDAYGSLEMGAPLEVYSVPRNTYGHGGVLPRGAAEFSILKAGSSVDDEVAKDFQNQKIENKSSIVIAGGTGIQITSYFTYPDGVNQKEISIYLSHKKQVYKVFFTYYEGDEVKFKKIMPDILSSLKFIDQSQIDTSTWKTYRNEKYGFEVKYPLSWYKGECAWDTGFLLGFGETKSLLVCNTDAPSREIVGLVITSQITTLSELVKEQSASNFKPDSMTNTYIGDIPAVRMEGVYEEPEGGWLGNPPLPGTRFTKVVTYYHGIAYIFNYSTENGDYLDEFNQVLFSFKFADKL
jgi:hypothetical protein